MEIKKHLWFGVKFFLNILVIVILFQLFGLWGLAGYVVFMLILAAWVLWTRRDLYLMICRYGAGALDSYFKGRKRWKEQKSRNN